MCWDETHPYRLRLNPQKMFPTTFLDTVWFAEDKDMSLLDSPCLQVI